jgi:hypothetical protein
MPIRIGHTSIVIKGELSCGEDLYIDGQVEGTIDPKGKRLTIGPHGRDRAEGKVEEAHMRLLAWCGHALFLEVMAEKADQRTAPLPCYRSADTKLRPLRSRLVTRLSKMTFCKRGRRIHSGAWGGGLQCLAGTQMILDPAAGQVQRGRSRRRTPPTASSVNVLGEGVVARASVMRASPHGIEKRGRHHSPPPKARDSGLDVKDSGAQSRLCS